ncbi:helix-turn-helix domain-containing protein [Mariniblastus sp.]|nr:helix-turn-helix domain-containing protein [Mariniblastus sp.]
MKHHVTIKEIARLLDCSAKTVRRKVKKGLIPAIQPDGPGTHIRFDTDDVIRAVKGRASAKDPPATNMKLDEDGVVNNTSTRPGPPPKWKQKLKQMKRGNNE